MNHYGCKEIPISKNESFYNHQQYPNHLRLKLKSGDIKLQVQPDQNEYAQTQSVQYYDTVRSGWFDCIGIESRKIEHWMRFNKKYQLPTFIVNIPNNSENTNFLNQAIFFDNQLYAFDVVTHQFIKINILNVETFTANINKLFSHSVTQYDDTFGGTLCYNERCFIIWKGRLFELKWLYDNEYPTIQYTSHLKWISSFTFICNTSPFGIALSMWPSSRLIHWVDERNDYLIFYKPNEGIVSRLTQNDIKFAELIDKRRPNIKNISWNTEKQSITICVGPNWMTNDKKFEFEIYLSVLKTMESRKCEDCFNEDAYAKSISFSQWKPQFDSDVFNMYMAYKYSSGFQKLKSGTKPITGPPIPISRAKYLYVCNHASSNYKIIAGFNMEQQTNYKQLKHLQSKEFKQLRDVSELADYLGAVIWYQCKHSNEYNLVQHMIRTATLVDFKDGVGTSTSIIIFGDEGLSVSNGASYLDLHNISWIGVIDNDNPNNQYNNGPISIPSMRYHVPVTCLSQLSCGNCGNGKTEKTKTIKLCGGCKQI
eukprot:293506_1